MSILERLTGVTKVATTKDPGVLSRLEGNVKLASEQNDELLTDYFVRKGMKEGFAKIAEVMEKEEDEIPVGKQEEEETKKPVDEAKDKEKKKKDEVVATVAKVAGENAGILSRLDK